MPNYRKSSWAFSLYFRVYGCARGCCCYYILICTINMIVSFLVNKSY